jgi:Protein of unknown function (DUF2841)
MSSRRDPAERPTSSRSSKKRPFSPDHDKIPETSTEGMKFDLTHGDERTIPSTPQVSFRISNKSEMDKFYNKTFLLLQQATMKIMLKAWIKFIEPEKQKRWPYCMSIEGRMKDRMRHPKSPDGKYQPPWWPEDIKHIEPDHLGKEGCHKLALVIIKRVQNLPSYKGRGVQMLREQTSRLDLRFNHEREEKYLRRQFHLNQLFEIAAKEQDFAHGCIGTCP